MNYTNTQLKQALAKMLPDVIQHEAGLTWYRHDGGEVLDTELLHLCWLVEETLTKRQCQDYTQGMDWEATPNTPPYDYVWHATWQQRTIALAKVKGIEL